MTFSDQTYLSVAFRMWRSLCLVDMRRAEIAPHRD